MPAPAYPAASPPGSTPGDSSSLPLLDPHPVSPSGGSRPDGVERCPDALGGFSCVRLLRASRARGRPLTPG
jgi:hypothetical protein